MLHMNGHASTRDTARTQRQEKLLRDVETEIKSLRHGRVVVDVCDGAIKTIDVTKRIRPEDER